MASPVKRVGDESTTKQAANEGDRHVGGRVRMRRMLVGMSQEKLGDALGLTFQQVQKYEKGTNRVSASRLRHISSVLGVSIDYLYDGMTGQETGPGGFSDNAQASYGGDADLLTGDGLKLLRAFHRIRDPKVRRRLIELVAAVSRIGEEPGRSE